MLSIGMLSRRSGVKVPTIRYYEEIGILKEAERTAGNQRRYRDSDLERLAFVKHARQLGFSLDGISSLIALQEHPDRSCAEAGELARAQRQLVKDKIARLQRLEQELQRISDGCTGQGTTGDCYVLSSLGDHGGCVTEHE
ncbi:MULTISPECIES: MerR family transcriptional regulator [Pacificibacter]|uniref:MerR family transcriptional regulator n=1 Tax=Pacificibacter TaxID=1042323 RepID=UPI001C0A0704|nr:MULTISPECIES: helix-turn-helix domain-containing protein [Pacificibacter]MBU2935335.1 helix-turn-helix domain-containing protein [Pacificibacter marinus]MDO6615490.1 helix-turn-helix domain-containing protein [Pacificibacter sp. 1_MG-2023]